MHATGLKRFAFVQLTSALLVTLESFALQISENCVSD